MSSLTTSADTVAARGVIMVHAVPRAIVPHVVWALRDVLARQAPDLDFGPQPVAPGCVRAVANWRGPAGSAARIASALRMMPDTLFEVTEDFASDREGERYACTPSLGLFRATIGVHGDIYLHEDRVRAAIAGASEHGVDLAEGLAHLLGDAWDVQLEPYRVATSDTPIRVLHHVI